MAGQAMLRGPLRAWSGCFRLWNHRSFLPIPLISVRALQTEHHESYHLDPRLLHIFQFKNTSPLKMSNGLTIATQLLDSSLAKAETIGADGSDTNKMQCDSVMRKRRKKMKKHKLRKRRKRQKAEKRKLSQGR